MIKKDFGITPDGRTASLYTFTNVHGAEMSVSDFGALLVSVRVPDREGRRQDVVLGYDGVEDYLKGICFFGAVIGRSGNRIADAKFTLNKETYVLPANENGNNLHSNPDGYEKRLWEVDQIGEQTVTFHLLSPDGDQGFPGNFDVRVTYTLTGDNEIKIHYEGICDRDTVVNMTNHSYFNLNGHDSGSVEEHMLQIHADTYTPVIDSKSIPTGELAPVKGTPMDFTAPKKIGQDIGADFEQLQFTGGYDHNYVLNKNGSGVEEMAVAWSEESGIRMTAYTDCVGVQFYAGNFVEDQEGKDGARYGRRSGFCLESQFYPNAVNTPGFPSPILKAGEKYDTTTIYKFEVM